MNCFMDHYNCQNCEKKEKGKRSRLTLKWIFKTPVNLNPLSGVPRLFWVLQVQDSCVQRVHLFMQHGLSFLEIHWLKQKELSFEMHTWSELWWAWAISGIWWIATFPGGERKCIAYGYNRQVSSQERGQFQCKERITKFRKQIIKVTFLSLWLD